MSKNLLISLIIFFSILQSVIAQKKYDDRKIKTYLNQLDENADWNHSSFALYLSDASGQPIIAINENLRLNPASGMKLLTTISALELLGEDYHYSSYLSINGKIDKEGTFKGDVIIRGSGDPSLGHDRIKTSPDMHEVLEGWTAAIKEKGIKRVDGRVIGDSRSFDDHMIPAGYPWDDVGNYYAAGASGLSFHENYFDIFFDSGKNKGDSTFITLIEPEIPGLSLFNEVKSGALGTGDNAYVYGSPYTDFAYIRGTIPPGKKNFRLKAAIPDPPLFTAQMLHKYLNSSGIDISQQATSTRKLLLKEEELAGEKEIIHEYISSGLKEIIYWTNSKSINIYAEHLIKTIGKELKSEGSYEAGIEAIEEHWKNKGMDIRQFQLMDGSGLSRANLITAAFMVKMLSDAKESEYFDTFFSSLAVLGESGTLINTARSTTARGKIFAKSGSMTGNRSYSGYIKDSNGQLLPFCMILNHYGDKSYVVRKKMENLMVMMVEMTY